MDHFTLVSSNIHHPFSSLRVMARNKCNSTSRFQNFQLMHRTTLDLFHGFTRVIKVRHLVHHKCVRSLARSKSTVYITKTGFWILSRKSLTLNIDTMSNLHLTAKCRWRHVDTVSRDATEFAVVRVFLFPSTSQKRCVPPAINFTFSGKPKHPATEYSFSNTVSDFFCPSGKRYDFLHSRPLFLASCLNHVLCKVANPKG